MSCGANELDLALSCLSEVLAYSKQKALYEADCRVRESLEKLRSVVFGAKAAEEREVVVDLARCKLKLAHLERCVAKMPAPLQNLVSPLLHELKTHIEGLRRKRETARHRQRRPWGGDAASKCR